MPLPTRKSDETYDQFIFECLYDAKHECGCKAQYRPHLFDVRGQLNPGVSIAVCPNKRHCIVVQRFMTLNLLNCRVRLKKL